MSEIFHICLGRQPLLHSVSHTLYMQVHTLQCSCFEWGMSVVSNGVAFTRSHHHSGYKLSKSHFSPTTTLRNTHLPHPFSKDTKTEGLVNVSKATEILLLLHLWFQLVLTFILNTNWRLFINHYFWIKMFITYIMHNLHKITYAQSVHETHCWFIVCQELVISLVEQVHNKTTHYKGTNNYSSNYK